jgi:D-amino-acid dehydrogenase
LRQAGHDVRVLERQAGAAQETSFGNGGQISVSHAEPWANPATLRKVVKWLGKDDAPLLFRPRLDRCNGRAAHYLRECLPSRVARNMRQIVALAEYSRQSCRPCAARRASYDHRSGASCISIRTSRSLTNRKRAPRCCASWAARATPSAPTR